ncbi:MAG: DUF2085 domain-containing protein, partial [Candidatus Altiarchaeota archaeon]|nr:DUF2085 domain-containing protein [Candidatus Altiarchaeota archaeon]
MKIEYLWPCKCIVEKDKRVSIFSIKLPLCSRCLGFQMGVVISMIVVLIGYTPTPQNPLLFMFLGMLLSLPTIIQGVSRRYHGKNRRWANEIIAFICGFLVAIGAL